MTSPVWKELSTLLGTKRTSVHISYLPLEVLDTGCYRIQTIMKPEVFELNNRGKSQFKLL